MKPLVSFYSRTGTTKKLADAISKAVDGDLEEIVDTKDRQGSRGYFASSRESALKEMAEIRVPKKYPSSYDCVIVGTPVWLKSMSTPIRTYIALTKDALGTVAFFCTYLSDPGDTFKDMATLCGRKPIALLSLSTKDILKAKYADDVAAFAERIKKPRL